MNNTRLFYTARRWYQLRNFIQKNKYSSVVLIFDSKLKQTFIRKLTSELNPDIVIPFHASEENKSLNGVQPIVLASALAGADSHSVFINAGGGTLCDTGAFAASVFKRGVDFIHIPTTLMAQCDAAIGGKTSLNQAGIKNVIGTFHFPVAILIEPDFLKSLDKRNLISGLAEIIKISIIADKKLFRQLFKMDFTLNNYSRLARKSAEWKIKIVSADPFDKGARQALNFGHTIGHAIESLFMNETTYLLHGEAVAYGMITESFLALQKKLISIKELNAITDLIIQHFNLPSLSEFSFDQLLYFMKFDKKNMSDRIVFSLPFGIGSCRIRQTASHDEIISALQYTNFVFQNRT